MKSMSNDFQMVLPEELSSALGINKWAGLYSRKYRDADLSIQEMMRSAVERGTKGHSIGHLRRNELLEIGRWKSSGRRNDRHFISNREIDVIEISHKAFADENMKPFGRLKHLTILNGVEIPTASAIMHFAFPETYPVIDVRALNTLGIKASSISPRLWYTYQKNCCDWADEYDVDLRTLDRALWQYDKDQKKRTGLMQDPYRRKHGC